MKCLSPEQKEAIMQMTDPAEMPLEERRRQYNAINRRINNPDNHKNFPAGLVEKWQSASTSEAKLLVIPCLSNYTCFFLSKYTYWLSLMPTQSTSTIAGPGSNS